MSTTGLAGAASQTTDESSGMLGSLGCDRDEFLALFDLSFYESQIGRSFPGVEEAIVDYLTAGAEEGRDPSPYFDTSFYFEQGLRRGTINPLVHYVAHAAENRAYRPNPIFGNGYYTETNDDVRATGINPLLHFLRVGARQGRSASAVHDEILRAIGGASPRGLVRAESTRPSVFFFSAGYWPEELLIALHEVARQDAYELRFVFLPGSEVPAALDAAGEIVDLGRFAVAQELKRASALRLLALSITARRPALALCETPHVLLPLARAGVSVCVLAPPFVEAAGWPHLGDLCAHADRVVIPSSDWLYANSVVSDRCPPNIALRTYVPGSGSETDFVHSVLRLLTTNKVERATKVEAHPIRASKIVIPCSDWGVSGVNSALLGVAAGLRERGWEIEILFTRDADFVLQSADGVDGLPDLPHVFLHRHGQGPEGMWAAAIEHLRHAAPCIMFMAYDFTANSIASALTDDVGAVMWLQADDGDYYEQSYRLGRYCNAVVCVSEHIRATISELHPGIASRASVIHNSSVRERDILEHRVHWTDKLRIVYTGRLNQYQKRILDFIDLADALERAGVPFEITLVGTFSVHDEAARLFPARAARHLEAGTIRLPGRLGRERIFAELRRNDFFVLLSDFEGLPLSLGEAMASGCVPVVAEMKSGVGEVLSSGENGLIVRGRDYDRWAESLVELWRDPRRFTAMSESARRTIRESFTVERVAERFDELFRGVAEELATGYRRPPALHWGEKRSPTGDVLPPPFMYRPVALPGLG